MTIRTLEQILFYSNTNVFISGTQTDSLCRGVQFRLPLPPAGSRCDLGLDSANLPRAAESLPLSAPALSLSVTVIVSFSHLRTRTRTVFCMCIPFYILFMYEAKIMH